MNNDTDKAGSIKLQCRQIKFHYGWQIILKEGCGRPVDAVIKAVYEPGLLQQCAQVA